MIEPESGLHYRREGGGHPLVLLSANPGDSRDFDAVVRALAADFDVLRPDWPGYGATPAPEQPEQAGAGYFLQRFSLFMQALALPPALLLGNSVGGNVAVRFALANPGRVRALVLVSPGGFTRHTAFSRAFCRVQGTVAAKALLGAGFTRWYLRERTPVAREMIARAGGEQDRPIPRRVNAAVWRSFLEPGHDLRQAAGGLHCPVLVVSGRRDPVIPAHTDGACAARIIPGARQLVFDCGHAPFAECPEAFLPPVLEFLQAAPDAAR